MENEILDANFKELETFSNRNHETEQGFQVSSLMLVRPNSAFRHPPPLISINDTAEVCLYPLETIELSRSYSNKEGVALW